MKKLLNNNNRIESSGQPAASGVEWPAGIPAPLPQILLAQSPECESNAFVVRYEELKVLTRSKKKKKRSKTHTTAEIM